MPDAASTAPWVTAVVPSYNHARFLRERLDSVFAQTYANLDVVLLDDASTDGSQEILTRAASDPRVSAVIFNKTNSGSPFHQWNLGVAHARGDLVWIAESDDACDPDLVATLARCFENAPGTVLAYAHSLLVHNGRVADTLRDGFYRELHPTRWTADFQATGREELANWLWRKNTIPNASAVVFSRRAFQAAGGADPTLRLCGDWLLWVRLLQQGDLAYCARPLNRFRVHARSARALQRGRKLVETVEPILRIVEFLQPSGALRADIFRRLARYWLGLALTGQVPWPAHARALARVRKVEPGIDRLLVRSLGATTRWGAEWALNRAMNRKARL